MLNGILKTTLGLVERKVIYIKNQNNLFVHFNLDIYKLN